MLFRRIQVLKYEILINPKWLRKLDNDIWNDDLVPAVLKIGKERFSIKIAYRGNVIRDKKKKILSHSFSKTVQGQWCA
jgi:spore coat protein H